MSRKSQWEAMLCQIGLPPDEIRRVIAAAVEADPSTRRAYVSWILGRFRAGEVRLPEDARAIRQLLEDWDRVKSQPALDGVRDITRHGYQTVAAFVRDALNRPSGRQRLALVKREGTEEVFNTGRYRGLKVTTPAAAAAHAIGTKWCTSDPDYAAAYLAKGPLYVILKDGRIHAQAHPCTFTIRDTADRPLWPDPDLLATLMHAIGPAGFLFTAYLETGRCYRERDFAGLAWLLQNFAGMNLLSFPLSYLPDSWIRRLWLVFGVTRVTWVWLRAARPKEPDYWAQTECLAFLRELRFERGERPALER
jgi:hypothetical protein